MNLGTLRRAGETTAVRIEDHSVIEIDGYADVGDLLRADGWRDVAAAAHGSAHPLDQIAPTDWAPLVLQPSKIVCVGLNYRTHIIEMGRELPEYPTLFAKYPEALIGAFDPIALPRGAADAVDWEGELAVVIGKRARKTTLAEAEASIAGYSVINDVTMRDYQYRTPEWFQGKTFEATTPFGPYLTTSDSYELGSELRTEVNTEVVQRTVTSDLVFSPSELIVYISNIVTLNPGDVIATGTPGGVGHARKPPRYLEAGQTLTTTIEGLGTQSNSITGGD